MRQKGIALVLVLWILVLITVATGAFALMARMDQLEANQLLSGAQSRLWAEAGLNLAALHLMDRNDETRPIADGRSYQQVLDNVLVETRIWDERGKLNINSADEFTLTTLFINNGLDDEQSEYLAAAIMDWRDGDDVERVNGAEIDSYEAQGLLPGPGNRNFMMVEELLQVAGMSYDLFRALEPGLTVFEDSTLPNLAYAPYEALLAIPDITPEEALNFVNERQSLEPENLLQMTLPNGQAAVASGIGLTYSIQVRATMPNGVWEQINATIRLGGTQTGQPYRILRWQEGFHY